MNPKSYRQSLPATAPSDHSGFGKGTEGLYVIMTITIGTSVSLPATISSDHSGFSKGTEGLYVIMTITIGTSLCDKNHSPLSTHKSWQRRNGIIMC